jgi:hypothetical protein
LAVAVLPPSRWTSFPRWTQWTVIVLAVALLALVGMAGRRAAAIGRQARPTVQKPKRSTMALTRLGAALVAAAPLLLLVLVTVASSPLRPGQLTDTWPGLAQWATWAAAVLWWLVLTLAVLMAFVLMYGLAMTRLLEIEGKRLHFGLVPGAVTIDSTGKGFGQRITRWFDRLAGMPSDTGVPPLSVWLADRIDDLAGVPPASGSEPRHALTFGDLWLGRAPVTDDDSERERLLREAAEDPRKRAVNLELMATNVSQGRPYKLPFAESKRNAAVGGSQFLFCQECLTSSLPDRVVRQMMSAPSVVEQEIYCPTHAQRRLRLVPEPWDLPVILAARMSMALPGLITAVPLFTAEESTDPKSTVGTRQWFSDGGITSNFPIHFFDSLLPRWPTFGLNLQAYPPTSLGEGVEPPEDVWIPPQDATSIVEPSRAIGSATAFAGAILDTSLGWRDTMQSALPGFRGRIAHVRQRSDEGGTNLFMKRKTILCLALRGLQAGDELKKRFTCKEGGQPEQTQTDQYRWIRMRLAMRKYRELAGEVAARSWLYTGLARRFEVPVELGGWFGNDAGPWPGPDPEASVAEATVTALAQLTAANQPLYAQVRGAPPLNPNLRLTPPE